MVTVRSYLNQAVSGIERFSTNMFIIFLLLLVFPLVLFPHVSSFLFRQRFCSFLHTNLAQSV